MRFTVHALLAASAIAFAIPAAAEMVSFELCGHVQSTTPMATAGSPVVGRFSWDPSAAAVPTEGGPPYRAFYTAPDTGPFTFTVGRHSVTAAGTGVTVWNDTGSNFADILDIGGHYPIVVDGTVFERGYFSVRLASRWDNPTALAALNLPAMIDVASFDAERYMQMYSGVTPNDLMLDVSIDWIRRADTPSPGQSVRGDCHPIAAAR